MKALLVGITTKYDRYDINYSLDELENLANSLDIKSIGRITQNLDSPNKSFYIGKGKLNEISLFLLTNECDIVIFNDELTPAQNRNITEVLKKEVIDRSFLILKIFELRAMTKEAKLEIKLAKDLYMLPRIQLMHENDDRIGGAGFTKGSGETQKELDRRHLLAEINHLKDELESLSKMKLNQIEKRKRNEIPIVALVGYTNAGKSTTLNTLINELSNNELENNKKNVLAKDQLFSTLHTYNRKLKYNKIEFMLVDTIGFVSKLPHNLVNSFYETLQEIKNADLIIHVVDSSSIYINEQINVVMEVLNSLKALEIPQFFLLNKWDKTISKTMTTPGFKSIPFSNKTKENIDLLLNTISEEISPHFIHAKLLIPYSKGDLSHLIEEKCQINHKSYEQNGTYFDCEIPKKMYNMFKDYDIDMMVS